MVEPPATVTEDGTLSSALSEDSVTVAPLAGAAADKVRVHVALPALPKLVMEQANELMADWPTSDRVTCCELLL